MARRSAFGTGIRHIGSRVINYPVIKQESSKLLRDPCFTPGKPQAVILHRTNMTGITGISTVNTTRTILVTVYIGIRLLKNLLSVQLIVVTSWP